MKTMYFRNVLEGANSAAYLPCEKPQKLDKFVVEIIDIPDNVDANKVQDLLNKTVIWKANVIEFTRLGEGMLVSSRGGRRPGAGRPATGRRKRNLYITEEEEFKIKKYIKKLRENE